MEIKGITVTLYEKTVKGKDEFDANIYDETPVAIHNVLVAPVSSEDIITQHSIKSDEVIYKLAIPKGDTHTWTECLVEFFGKTFKVVGEPVEGIEEMLPLSWNKQVQVKYYG